MAKKGSKKVSREVGLAVAEPPSPPSPPEHDEASQIPRGQLGDWLEKVPPVVQKATEEYVASLRDMNKAREAINIAKSHCLSVMEEFSIDSVPIDEGGRRLVRFSEMKLKTKKAEDEPEG